MDIASLILGASIASIAWITIYPWGKLKRLSEFEAIEQAGEPTQYETRSQ